jgi:hypothetical protein
MRKIYFLFLFVSGFAFGQETVSYITTISNLNYRITEGVKRTSDDSKIRITINFESGPSKDMYLQRIANINDNETNLNLPSFESSVKPISVDCYAYVNFRTGTDADGTVSKDLNTYCPNGTFDGDYSPRMTHVTFDYKVEPKLDVITPGLSDDLPTDDFIVIKSIPGYNSNYYNWQFLLSSDLYSDPNLATWVDLPQYYGQSSITTNAIEILGINAAIYHGKKIAFRLKPCGLMSNGLGNYKIRKSAPSIVSYAETKTTCSYTDDGKLRFTLNRPLLNVEKLTCSILRFNEEKQIYDPDDVVYSTQEPEGIVLDRNNNYVVPNDFSKGKYALKFIGSINAANTYPSTDTTPFLFKIESPTPVEFLITKTDIRCHNGQDGEIEITASGGADDGIYQYSTDHGAAWSNFSNGSKHTITGLAVGMCFVKVRKIKDVNDTVGCIAKLPNDNELSESISQPPAPVTVSNTFPQEPTFYGGSNGKITASISGGTLINGNSYWYEWRNSKNEILNNIDKTTTQFIGGLYAITLNDVPADTYTLMARDRNYDLATQKAGCSLVPTLSIILKQPDPLEVTLEVQRTISCNAANEFGNETDMTPNDGQRDESQDGILVAHVKGGVSFTGFQNNGLRYKYFWKKQQDNGTWIPLDDKDETAQYLSHGNYALNIEDKNGIRLGTYVNNILTQERDSVQFMKQPTQLELKFTKGDIFCSEGNNGWAKANVTGGTPPYAYQWTNGDKTETIAGLTTNNYFVKITDAKGCSTQGSVLIEQPNGVVVNETIYSPSCFQGNDGSITLEPTGGITPYYYVWSTGATSQNIANLTAGNYSVTLKDAQGCVSIKNFTLINPDPITINLGSDRTLCNSQSLDLDISIANPNTQYSWTSTNGFVANTAKVTLTQAGTYHAKATSGLGCISEDEIVIKSSEAVIDSEFLLSSQAYLDEEVILVNTSNPFEENTQWVIPSDVTIVNQKEKYIILKFKDLGVYTISLKQTQGDCYAVYTKSINVEQRSTLPNGGTVNSSFINDFIVTPNPSDGNFEVLVNLENDSPIGLRLFAYNGQNILVEKKESGKKNYVVDFNVKLASGMYVLVLETVQQTLVKKIIIY